MIPRRVAILTTVLLTVCVAMRVSGGEHAARQFEVRYAARFALPDGARSIRIWMPYPESDAWQTVRNVVVRAPISYDIRHDPEYGNAIVYLESNSPTQRELAVDMTFDVERREVVNKPSDHAAAPSSDASPGLLDRFRKPDRLVPIDGRIAEVALEATRDQTTPIGKARAIYDYVTTRMRYDKSGEGWGRGDAIWACDARRGNCTDFHSLLIGMARAVGIPAKFEIGLPLPAGDIEGPIPGYHCWAELYLDGLGWVPVDSSEGSKHPDKKDYYFGALDPNRVRLTIGRDILLDPRQSGEPVNFLVYPYVEIDGVPQHPVAPDLSFRDRSPSQDARRPRASGST
jgi:transglutaminase-like putative cysteine protease